MSSTDAKPDLGKRTVVELETLRNRLREAEETLAAIRNGEVDSLVVSGPQGNQVFSLKGAEQPYRVFVEQMFEGAVTLTVEGTILYSNARFAEMMRCPLQKVIGGQIQTFVQAGDREYLEQLLSEPDGKKARFVLQACDGSVVAAQLALGRMPIGDVETVGLVVTDLTEQEEKQELAAALASLRVAQDLLQRQNEELQAAQRAAEAANQAKDNFLASLSHELRTPLAPVMMTVATLERTPSFPAEFQNSLRMIRRNVELEARLIDDLLDITRIVRGKLDLRSQPLDAHQVLNSALEICRSDMEAKRLELALEFEASRSGVIGDPVRVQQILWNLLRNATKFTPDGGRITVRTANHNDELHISVTDTGIGVDQEALGKIFVPFEQTDRNITRQFGGLGLGLAISRRLAQLHGGTVTASSPGSGQGATFTLILPTAVETSAHDQNPDSHRQQAKHTGLRILLVEDHDDTRMVLGEVLRKKHTVREAFDIASALEAAGKEQYDLLISDLGLPDGTGLDLLKRVRQLQNVRSICLSGYGMEHDVSRSREAGFEMHLTKPVELDRLEAVVDSFAS